MSELACIDGWLYRGLCGLMILLAVAQLSVALAEPCTLYKAEDVAKARENVKRYKWAQAIVNGWKGSVD